MKRYLLFSGSDYYPSGGWKDFNDSFDSAEEARAKGNSFEPEYYWYHVVDSQTGQII